MRPGMLASVRCRTVRRQAAGPSLRAAARSLMSRSRAGPSRPAKVTRPPHCLVFKLCPPRGAAKLSQQMPVSIRTRGPACQRPGDRAPLLTLLGPRAANNLFVFPAIALAAHLGQTKVITDHMLMAAAEARPTLVAVLLSSSY